MGIAPRDYNDEADDVILLKDPAVRPDHLQLWLDHAPAQKKETDAFVIVDDRLSKLDASARAAAWDRDSMKLAKDVANLGRLYNAEVKSERAIKTNRLLHLRGQNTIGASIVNSYMTERCSFVSGNPGELEIAVEKAPSMSQGIDCLEVLRLLLLVVM